jgi:uncharacterized protein YceK
VNNAGISNPENGGGWRNSGLEAWNHWPGVNLTGAFLMSKHALPLLRRSRWPQRQYRLHGRRAVQADTELCNAHSNNISRGGILEPMLKSTVFSAIVIISLSGCASIYTQSTDYYAKDLQDCSGYTTIPNVYSGVIFDLYCLPAENAGFFCLIDLPLSVAADTLMLPYTIHKQMKQGHWFSTEKCEEIRKAGSNF